MSTFRKLFDNSSDTGTEACNLVQKFLSSAQGYKLSEYTFTELFAFLYFELDSVMSARKMESRRSIVNSLSTAYCATLESKFRVKNVDEHINMMKRRISEYAQDQNSGKERSDIVERLSFYLDQASIKNGYHVIGDPLGLGDFFVSMNGKMELANFYIKLIAPFVRKTIP